MSVSRISTKALQKILDGGINSNDKTTVVVKFYSNNCHYCHALSDYYIDLAGEYDDIYFFAHNVDDDGVISSRLKLNGVPSIGLFQTHNGRCVKTRVLPDPPEPHEKTWYTIKYIKNFINRNHNE